MFETLKEELTKHKVQLVAVSKTKPNKAITELYELGQRAFGENRVQELVGKHKDLPKDIQWHLIGSLQKNKVKHIASFVSMIHSVDSLELAQVINKEAVKQKRTIDVLLQFKIAEEESKHGLDLNTEIKQLKEFTKFQNLRICGLMGMASFVSDQNQIKREFKSLKNKFSLLSEASIYDPLYFKEISMGMSGDYKIAINEGATIVRIGSLLFGSRY